MDLALPLFFPRLSPSLNPTAHIQPKRMRIATAVSLLTHSWSPPLDPILEEEKEMSEILERELANTPPSDHCRNDSVLSSPVTVSPPNANMQHQATAPSGLPYHPLTWIEKHSELLYLPIAPQAPYLPFSYYQGLPIYGALYPFIYQPAVPPDALQIQPQFHARYITRPANDLYGTLNLRPSDHIYVISARDPFDPIVASADVLSQDAWFASVMRYGFILGREKRIVVHDMTTPELEAYVRHLYDAYYESAGVVFSPDTRDLETRRARSPFRACPRLRG